MNTALEELRRKGLYDASFEHDNCGIGAIVQMDGKKCHALADTYMDQRDTVLHSPFSWVESGRQHRSGQVVFIRQCEVS